MREIITVTGKLDPSEVKFCQFHEHLLLRKGRSFEIHPALWMENLQLSAQEALSYRKAGGTMLIDAQPGGCGRMADGLAEISKKTGVQILCSTGFHKMIFYPEDHWIFLKTAEELEEYFVRELTLGVCNGGDMVFGEAEGDQRAGMIKCALDTENLTPQYEKLFRAAAGAAVRTDRTMMVHIEKGSDPLLLLDFLLTQGVDPAHLVFCHMDRAVADLGIHQEVLRHGVYLEFDTIGRFKYHSDQHEAEIFKKLLDAGFEDQLLFSLDTTRERMRAYHPQGVGLDYILNTFLATLKAAGVTEEQIQKISRDNCIRALL